MSDAPLAINVRGIIKSFGDHVVVNNVDLQIPTGKIVGFLGPNGSGKTTTLRMLCGLLTPDAGEGTCLGLDLRKDAAEIKRHTGYMTQRFSFYEDLTIHENLDFVARLYQLDNCQEQVEAALVQLGLIERRNQLTGTLSGGWKQRLALAACILHKPKLLLLDEPTAGVDPKARREFWDEIHTLSTQGITVLVSTHYMDEAERCHEIAYISYGNLVAKGTVTDIIQQSQLFTWRAHGKNADHFITQLRESDGIEMAVAFGSTLHVSSTDKTALKNAINPYIHNHGLTWEESTPTLEDVFIHLMATTQDNFK